MAREQVGYDPRPEGLATTVSPNFQQVQPQSAEVIQSNSNAFRLAETLGSGTLQLQKREEEQTRLKTEEQQRKLPYYADLFKQDMPDGGAVTQAQVRARFPETVPVIAARIAEIMGGDEAKKHAALINEHILNDDTLKLDTVARTAYIAQQKQEYTAKYAGKGNDFFSSGYLASFENGMNQYQGQYAQATAQYHTKIQADSFSSKVEGLFYGNQEDMLTGLDEAWKTSSSLNNLDRNKIVIDTVTNMAFNANDPDMLDRIPNRFLNAESSNAIAVMKQRIASSRQANYNYQQSLNASEEKEALKRGKNDIVTAVAEGKPFNPNMYSGNAELFQFAVLMRETPPVSTAESTSNKELFITRLLTDSTFNYSTGQEAINNQVINNMSINPTDKAALIKEIPKLMEGYQALRDPVVTDMLGARINPRLSALERSPSASIASLIEGRSLRTEITTAFNMSFMADMRAAYADTGSFPVGRAKQEILSKNIDKAEADLMFKTKLENLQEFANTNSAPTPATPAAAAPKPNATTIAKPKAPTKGGKTQVMKLDGTPMLFNGEPVYKYN